MRLTVLGSSASYAMSGQACSGYLIEGGGARVLLDCGNGVVANLFKVCDPTGLDAVFLTHGHPDHFCDVYALQALVRYAPQGPTDPLALYAPRGLFETMGSLLGEQGRAELAAAFLPHVLEPDATVMIGDLAVTPVLVEHVDETFALIVEEEGGHRMCFTSDTRAGSLALRAAAGSNLLLAEATLPEEYKGRVPHMTAAEAGALARVAGAGRLVLTHLWPTNDRDHAAVEAAGVYDGPIFVASEFDVFEI